MRNSKVVQIQNVGWTTHNLKATFTGLNPGAKTATADTREVMRENAELKSRS